MQALCSSKHCCANMVPSTSCVRCCRNSVACSLGTSTLTMSQQGSEYIDSFMINRRLLHQCGVCSLDICFGGGFFKGESHTGMHCLQLATAFGAMATPAMGCAPQQPHLGISYRHGKAASFHCIRWGRRRPMGTSSMSGLTPVGRVLCRGISAEFPERSSPDEVKKEIKKCYELVHRLGRGVLYLGSSRVKADHPHYLKAMELARDIARLLDCTTWSGVGPGLMDAACKGAMSARKPVGGLKISREAGEWTSSNFHPYLPSETYLTCRFFSARKHGLVDAAVRNSPSDRTAVVAFPGGIGTLDEVFEILTLIQLERLGSDLPVPFLLMNYDSFYTQLLDFINDCEKWGTVAKGEVGSLWKVCDGNLEALEYLADFYNIPQKKRDFGIQFETEH